MNPKINIQARIKRHSRILKNNLWNTLHYSSNKSRWFWLISFFVILLFPLYPSIVNFWSTQTSFYRWDIDEESILSYFDFNEWITNTDTNLIEEKDWYLDIWALVEDDNSTSNEMIIHEVKKWDTLSLISQKYWVSEDTILWANKNITKWDKSIKIGTVLSFPPVTGVIYKVKRWDTVLWIALKYDIPSKNIIAQNNIKNNYLKISQYLTIPWWKYIKKEIIKKPKYKDPTKKTYTKKTSYIAKNINSKWLYPLKWRPPYSWAWWNCTYYVASYKNVNWRWNANRWLKNSRAKGHSTGMKAIKGSIIVLWGRWYNRRYWHVWIVREVQKNHLIISDMNYKRLNQVTVRKIKRWNNPTIKGFIYIK